MLHLLLSLASLSAPLDRPQCGALAGVDQLLARPGLNYLLVGEYHGTVEMPQVAADVACKAVTAGRPVVIALEFAPENQVFLDAYMRSDGGPAAHHALLKAPAWKEQGGRASQAVLALAQRARALSTVGPVRLAAFDLVPEPIVSKVREEGLARGLMVSRKTLPGALVVALIGQGHAGKTPWTSQSPPFASTGQLLPQPETLALVFARPGGQYWGCQDPRGDKSGGCKAYDMPAREDVTARSIRLDGSREGFDGIFSPGRPYTASPPVRVE